MLHALASIAILIQVIVLYILFYYQNKRQEMISQRNIVLTKWCKTLMENDKIVSKDLQKLYNEFQAYKTKEDKRERRSKED